MNLPIQMIHVTQKQPHLRYGVMIVSLSCYFATRCVLPFLKGLEVPAESRLRACGRTLLAGRFPKVARRAGRASPLGGHGSASGQTTGVRGDKGGKAGFLRGGQEASTASGGTSPFEGGDPMHPHPRIQRRQLPSESRNARTSEKTARNISGVRTPVFVL
jgi:hypothetical protein